MKTKDKFTITEHIKVNPLEFVFSSFSDIAHSLRVALSSGLIKRGKRYKFIIEEV